jgi:hypothetical protein
MEVRYTLLPLSVIALYVLVILSLHCIQLNPTQSNIGRSSQLKSGAKKMKFSVFANYITWNRLLMDLGRDI